MRKGLPPERDVEAKHEHQFGESQIFPSELRCRFCPANIPLGVFPSNIFPLSTRQGTCSTGPVNQCVPDWFRGSQDIGPVVHPDSISLPN